MQHNRWVTCWMLWAICIVPLPNTVNSVALRPGPCVMVSHRDTCQPRVLYSQGLSHIWNIYIRNVQQYSHRITHGLLQLLHVSPTPKGWQPVSGLRIPRPGVEPGPLASEASVLPMGHLYSTWYRCGYSLISVGITDKVRIKISAVTIQ